MAIRNNIIAQGIIGILMAVKRVCRRNARGKSVNAYIFD